MMRRIAALTATTMLLAGGALATATSASASVYPSTYDYKVVTAGGGATLYITKHGDTLTLCDTKADGYAPRATIRYEDSVGLYDTAYYMIASGGEGTCTAYSAANGGSYNLPEDEIWTTVGVGPNYLNPANFYYDNNA
jgi:hypothetical protein